jgi:hypothetical protein
MLEYPGDKREVSHLERFRFFVEEIERNVTIFTLSAEECRTFIARYNQLKEAEAELCFQTYVLDGLVDSFQDKLLGLIEEAVKEDQTRLTRILDGLFSVCLSMNPMLNFMAMEMMLPDLSAEDDPLPMPQAEPKKEELDLPARKERVRHMYDHLRQRVVGQEMPGMVVSQAFKRAAVGINDPTRPVCSYILAGSSGVGKTLMAKEINSYLYPNQPLIRIDCSEYQQEHEYAKLIGCFIPGSQVSLPGGEQRCIEEVVEGDMVVNHKGEIGAVRQVYEYYHDGTLVFFRSCGDPRATVCTPRHEILIWNNELQCGVWTPARDLKEGQWLFFPHGEFPDEGESGEAALWELLGWYLSRGKLIPSQRKVSISFWKHEIESRRRVLQLATEYFELDEVYVTTGEEETMIVTFVSEGLAGFCNVATRSHGRWLPPWLVEELSHQDAIHLFCGLFGISEDLTENYNAMFVTYYADLYSQVRLVGAKLGYLPTAGMLEDPDGQTLYRMTLPWCHLWNIIREFRGLKPVEAEAPSGQCKVTGGTALQIVRTTEAIYNGPVYDLSLWGETSYLVNQIAVHNSPPGYKDSDREGYLTGRLRKTPHSIVLIDEIEKADPRLFDLFLQILDEGMLTDNRGNPVDCSKAAFFFTTNLGNDYIKQQSIGFCSPLEGEGDDHAEYMGYVLSEIADFFRLELIARVNDVLVFHRLTWDDYLKIVDMEVKKLLERLRHCGDFRIRLTKTAREVVVERGATIEYGARGISDILRNVLEDGIADYLLDHEVKGGTFRLGWSRVKDFKLELLDPKRVRKQGGEKSAERSK